MANAPMGNNFFEGVLGVVNVTYNSIEMGKTTADTEIVPDKDVKDIIFQQSGTKFYDKVMTGMALMVNFTIGEITTTRLEQAIPGWVKSGLGNSMKLGKSIYQSWRDNSKTLKLTRADSEGTASTNPKYALNFYKAFLEVTGNIQYGADTQRNLAITAHIFWDETKKAFGYSGYASSLGL